MGEPRPDTPPADPPRRAVARTGLTRLQQAYSDYVQHALGCISCRDVDAERCVVADGLWQAYQRESDDAYRRMSARDA